MEPMTMPMFFDLPDGTVCEYPPEELKPYRGSGNIVVDARNRRYEEFARVMRATDWDMGEDNLRHALDLAHRAYLDEDR
jgi:hypothetical protein